MTTTPEPAAPASRGAVDLSALGHAPAPAAGTGAGPAAPEASRPPAGSWSRPVGQQDFADLMQLSARVPVVVSLGSARLPVSAEIDAVLASAVDAQAGRLVLATVDTDREPAIAQAFRIQQVPAVVALLNGQPVPMFQGAAAPEEIRALLDELVQLGVQHGVAGTVPPFSQGGGGEEPALPPLHQKAIEAIDAGDYEAAAAAYRQALAEKPNDADAQTGLSQVGLLQRTADLDLQAVRQAAAEHPDGLAEQLAVADLDVVGGHVEDAFARLVAFIGRHAGEEREAARQRLVELYAVVGVQDPRVVKSRQALARVLF
ncbi:co-chaperone YbbN [Zafaria cholistanensis]|uniref:Co-chaperone YbbN n=1 Tax=Zafaria cholistanensis TaxID=1682741 RepID=A0A5A7NTS6_9MICC|nr:tetratricopeptide repeat protein [Zafaria cholistanensis]GER24169.1 co-chaperone YbbN [Zafaria cholistanensis]